MSNRSIFCKFVDHYTVQPQNSYPKPMYSKIRFPPSTCNIWIKKSWLTPKKSTMQLYKLRSFDNPSGSWRHRFISRSFKRKWKINIILLKFPRDSNNSITKAVHIHKDTVSSNIVFLKDYRCSLQKAVVCYTVTISETTVQPFHFI